MLKILCIAICAAAFFAQLSFSNPTSSEWTLMDQERDERPSSALGDRMRSDHLGMGDEEGPMGHMGRGVDRQLTGKIAFNYLIFPNDLLIRKKVTTKILQRQTICCF